MNKININPLDKVLLRRTQLLAKLSFYKNRPNPQVGSILSCNNKILSEGFHEKFGYSHAEVNCLKNYYCNIAKNSKLFISIEPCNHFGKTPPCTQLILDKNIKNVVVERIDPNKKMSGKSLSYLTEMGVNAINYSLCNGSHDKIFETNMTKNRPYIILKYAQSANSFIDNEFKPIKISNKLTDRFTHKLRHENDAIIIGHNTLKSDRPKLTNRHFYGRSPIIIVFVKSQLSTELIESSFDSKSKIIVFNTTLNSTKNGNIIYDKMDSMTDIEPILNKMYSKYKITSILIEGGQKILNTFISKNTWDEAFIITNQKLFIEQGTLAPHIDGKVVDEITLRSNTITKLIPTHQHNF